MEGLKHPPQTSMIRFQLRHSAGTPEFKQKLNAFISANYNECPEAISQEIVELEALRLSSVDLQFGLAECSKLKKYFCQLNFLKTKFPLNGGSPTAVKFSWHSIDTNAVNDCSDIDFEMCCILYNIGASHTQMATLDSTSTQTSDEIKMSCTHFECAAWIFQHLRHNFPKLFTQDISPDLLSIFKNICLAQAQECVLQMSFINGQEFQNDFTVKVAIQVVEYFQLAQMSCSHVLSNIHIMNGGSGKYSDELIMTVKKWKELIGVKVSYYSAVAFIYRGLEFDANYNLYECIGCYRAAKDKLNEAIKSDKTVEKTDSIYKTLEFAYDCLSEKLSTAELRNPSRNPIPSMDSILTDIKGEKLVKGIAFEFSDPTVAGRTIFNLLQPIDTHKLYTRYSIARTNILRDYSTQIESKNEALDKLLIEIRLEHLEANGTTLPKELLDCVTTVSSKDGFSNGKTLSNTMNDVSTKTTDIDKKLQEVLLVIELLEMEQTRNFIYFKDVAETKSGIVIADLSSRAKKFDETFKQSYDSDRQFLVDLKTTVSHLNILAKPLDQLQKLIPDVPTLEKDRDLIAEMKKISGELVEIREERVLFENLLRDSIYSDAISSRVPSQGDIDGNAVYQEMLKTHNKYTQKLDDNFRQQDDIIKDLAQLNVTFSSTRNAIANGLRKRNQVIQSWLTSVETYEMFTAKLEKRFQEYKKLEDEVNLLLEHVRNAWQVQDEEKEIQMAIQEANKGAVLVPSAGASAGSATVPDNSLPDPNANATTNLVTSSSTGSSQSGINTLDNNQQFQYNSQSAFDTSYDTLSMFDSPQVPPRSRGWNSSTSFQNPVSTALYDMAQALSAQSTATTMITSTNTTTNAAQNGPKPNYQHPTSAYYQSLGKVIPQTSVVNSSTTTASATPLITPVISNVPQFNTTGQLDLTKSRSITKDASIIPIIHPAVLYTPQLQFKTTAVTSSTGLTTPSTPPLNTFQNWLTSGAIQLNTTTSGIVPATTSTFPNKLSAMYPYMSGHSNPTLPQVQQTSQNGYNVGSMIFNQTTQQWEYPMQPLTSTTIQPPQPIQQNPSAAIASYFGWSNPNANTGIYVPSPRAQLWNLSTGSATATAFPSTSNPNAPATYAIMDTSIKPYTTRAAPATPPMWEESCDEAIQALTPFHKTLVPNSSVEYQVINDLVCATVQPTTIERVINTELWKKFTNTRRDFLVSKSDDLGLLQELGVSEKEIHHRAHASFNYDKAAGVLPYSDNVALLYHCTRGKVDPILSQGLDERLGNSTGLLGRGIYFADDPQKSITYDGSNGALMIFAVFLGDCFSVDHLTNKNTFVREPEKTKDQKRSHTDLFFDSIVGRPNSANEYVIYNRFQCCPLYLISYRKGSIPPQSQHGKTRTDIYAQTRSKLPPFAWTKTNRQTKSNWPFYAQTIFDLMTEAGGGAKMLNEPINKEDESEATILKLSAISDLGFTDDKANLMALKRFGYNLERAIDFLLENASTSPMDTTSSNFATTTTATTSTTWLTPSASFASSMINLANSPESKKKKMNETNKKYDKVFAAVLNAAPTDPNLNTTLPVNYGTQSGSKSKVTRRNRVAKQTINWPGSFVQAVPATNLNPSSVVVQGTGGTGTSTSGALSHTPAASLSASAAPVSAPASISQDEDCPICCVEYPPGPQHWKILKCNHKLCTACNARITTTGTTMSGQTHTFTKCPFCQTCSGVEIGTCPNGTMTLSTISGYLLGYENYNTMQINYNVAQGKYTLNRTAYLPNSPEGVRVYNLLCIAWDRRLCFSIGTSMTTGKQDCLVWNIHHKTATQGGVQGWGFPDETYLERVLDELKQYNIE